MKANHLLIIAAIAILGAFAAYEAIMLQRYQSYYEATESYLDEIDEFYDTATGSDAHCEYLDCREALH